MNFHVALNEIWSFKSSSDRLFVIVEPQFRCWTCVQHLIKICSIVSMCCRAILCIVSCNKHYIGPILHTHTRTPIAPASVHIVRSLSLFRFNASNSIRFPFYSVFFSQGKLQFTVLQNQKPNLQKHPSN